MSGVQQSVLRVSQGQGKLGRMSAVLTWIQSNPSAAKSYMLAVLALVAKGILACTGKTADLGQYSGFIDQAIDLIVGGLSIYGLIAGSIHASRGPALTPTESASVIVAALAPAQVGAAVEQVKAIVADVVEVKRPVAQSFPESHQF
jgi:hypothetical protein